MFHEVEVESARYSRPVVRMDCDASTSVPHVVQISEAASSSQTVAPPHSTQGGAMMDRVQKCDGCDAVT